ncbi:MAG TPA: ATP-binding protein, partial [Thermoanaerobaculia bacterium]|nr:ATP-binding protein [Thermoanaerobaculia bacterium]
MTAEPKVDAQGRSPAAEIRFKKAIQRSRAGTYTMAVVIGWVFTRLGVLNFREGEILAMLVVSVSTAPLFYWIGKRQVEEGWSLNTDFLWLAADVVLTTWAVAASGGYESPWFVWYLSAAGAASFVLGRLGASVFFSANTVAYLALLFARGEIHFFDPPFFLATARMFFVHGAAFFFLRGVVDLRAKRLLIARMREDESRKVAELTRLTTDLDRRSRELSDANRRIQEADRHKSQFLANMSHELRTPLNSIIGFSDVLKTRLDKQIPEKYLRFLENINTSGLHLLSIINDILDLSKIEAGKMELHPEPFGLNALVDGVAHVMKGTTAKRRIAIEIDVPADLPSLEADPVKFKQILYNLLANAVKFSPEDATVTVRGQFLPAISSPIGEDALAVDVVDRGIGIDPKDHAVVFQEFRQADGGAARKYEGTGLGLALVRSLVELHRGRVVLTSEVGRGSTFTVVIPCRFRGLHSEDTGGIAPAPELAGRPRVLVIEDDPDTYLRMAEILHGAGYLPLRARSGEEALSLAASHRPSAITLDIVLPGCDGWEVLGTLKKDPETRGIPVLIVSRLDNRELGVALGADGYFVKPVEGDELLARLHELAPRYGPSHPRLLLIDDEPAVHDMLTALLEPEGYRLDHALTGAQGLELVEKTPP